MSIAENDTVILSARIIPGNEKAIFRMIDHLFRRRVLVYYEGGRSAPIHVSGHASQEEMKILLQLVQAEIFHSAARRIPASIPACGACRANGRGLGRDFPARERPADRIHAGWQRVSPRTGHRRARAGRFGLARGNRRSGDSRPAASCRRWRGGAHHRYRQAHGRISRAAGNRHARIPVRGRRRKFSAKRAK